MLSFCAAVSCTPQYKQLGERRDLAVIKIIHYLCRVEQIKHKIT